MNIQSSQFSFFKGYSFVFKVNSNVIESWFSCFSGLEKVKVNGKLVAKQRNLSTNSNAQFVIDGSSFRTNLHVENIFKGPFVCSLYKDEKLTRQQKVTFPAQDKSAPFYGKLWFSFIFGLLVGFTSYLFEYPIWLGFIFIVVMCTFVYMKGKKQKPFIEEIHVQDI